MMNIVVVDMIWNFFYEVIKSYYLKAPKFMGGQENQKIEDICAQLLGISSNYFFTTEGFKICEDKVHNVLTSYTTIFITAMCLLMLSQSYVLVQFFINFYKAYQTETDKKERNARRSMKASETRKQKSELHVFASTVSSILRSEDLNSERKIFLISESLNSLNDKTLEDIVIARSPSIYKRVSY